MRFYIVHDHTESTIGCEITLKAAHALGRQLGGERYSITKVDCLVNVDTIRRLLGNVGGFAIGNTTREYRGRK